VETCERDPAVRCPLDSALCNGSMSLESFKNLWASTPTAVGGAHDTSEAKWTLIINKIIIERRQRVSLKIFTTVEAASFCQ
jgi:hypothetical protein